CSCRSARGSGESFSMLQLAPDVLKFVETSFAGEPFGRQHGAFGKASAGFCVMAEVYSIGFRLQHDLVQAYDLSFTKGSNFDVLLGAAGFTKDVLHHDGGAGGSVLLVDVVAFENLPVVVVAQRCGCGARHFQKDIYAY